MNNHLKRYYEVRCYNSMESFNLLKYILEGKGFTSLIDARRCAKELLDEYPITKVVDDHNTMSEVFQRKIPNTQKSIDLINNIVKEYMDRDGHINESIATRDLLTDLMHFCEDKDINFQERVQSATDVFTQEEE